MDPVGIGALAFLLWCLLSLPAGMLLGRCLRYGRNGPPPLLRIPGQRSWNPSIPAPRPGRTRSRRRPAGVGRAGVAAGLVAGVSVLTMSAAAAVQSTLSPTSPQAVHRVLDILTPFSSGSPPPLPVAEPERSPARPVKASASAVQTAADGAPSSRPAQAEPGVGVWRAGAVAAQVPAMLLPTAPGAPAATGPLLAGPVVDGSSGLVDTPAAVGAGSPAKGPMATVTGDDEVVAAPPAGREHQHEEPPPDVPAAAVAAPGGPGSSAGPGAATSAGTPASAGAPAAAEEATVGAAGPVETSTPVETSAPVKTSTPVHTGAPPTPGRPDHAGRPDEPGRPDHAGQPGVGRPGTVAPAPAATPTTSTTTSSPAPQPAADATETTGTTGTLTTVTEVPPMTATGLESAAP